MKLGDKIAQHITAAMATWTFIAVFLFVCLFEILGNHSGWFHFDPQTIILNLFLSLVAAIQGSIIMIAQNQHDLKNDRILEHLERMEEEQIEREKNMAGFIQSYLEGKSCKP